MKRIEFTVYGDPQQQGSMKGFVRGGKVALTSTNPRLDGWRTLVARQAQDVSECVLQGPVRVEAFFILPRPKSRPQWQIWPTSAPDLDKLVRAVGDALTHIVVRDDSQIVEWIARKSWADEDFKPGVHITVQEMENDRRARE